MPASRIAVLLAASLLSACSTASYYAHVIKGGWQVLSVREPIARIIDDPTASDQLKARLSQLLEARRFASTTLALPDNGSYTSYSALGRSHVVWNVFATPEFSLTPVTHCFWFAGCVAYRGYYRESLARDEAQRLQAKGYETFVGGVSAYSTLGWFDDPVLSTMLAWDDERLSATIFHELAHQNVYVPGDTAFNESYGKFVELEGLRQWRLARGLAAQLPADLAFEEIFINRMLQARQELERLYASGQAEAALRAAKAQIFVQLQADIEQLDAQWQAGGSTHGFFATPMNNARLLPFGLYHQWRPAFAVLFEQQHHDWRGFHVAVKALAALDAATRLKQLTALNQLAPSDAITP
jgi:predicted aminopeptidase